MTNIKRGQGYLKCYTGSETPSVTINTPPPSAPIVPRCISDAITLGPPTPPIAPLGRSGNNIGERNGCGVVTLQCIVRRYNKACEPRWNTPRVVARYLYNVTSCPCPSQKQNQRATHAQPPTHPYTNTRTHTHTRTVCLSVCSIRHTCSDVFNMPLRIVTLHYRPFIALAPCNDSARIVVDTLSPRTKASQDLIRRLEKNQFLFRNLQRG